MSSSADLGTAHARVTIDVSQLSQGVSAASAQFAKLEGSTKGLSSSLSSVASSFALIGGGLAVGIGAAVNSFASFEAQINTLGAVSGATGAELGKLSDLALDIGKSTTVGAGDAAAALTELSKAGVSTADILEGAGRAAVLLSQAGGIGVADAAKTMANAMNVFNISGEKAAHVADVFAAAANTSAADVDGLALSLAQVGTVADAAGLSFEQTAGALALFADAGLRGSDAGTSLKTALTAMIAPSSTALATMKDLGIAFQDAQGRFVGLAAAAGILQRALGPLSESQRNAALAAIFGQDALRVGVVLYNQGAAAVTEYTNAVNQTGAAQEVANARMQGLAGTLEQLRGSIETAAIAFGAALAPAAEAMAKVLQGVVDTMARLPPVLQQIGGGLAATAAGVALTVAGFAKIAATAIDGAKAMRQLRDDIRASQAAMGLLTAAVSPAALALAAIGVITLKLIADHEKHKQAIAALKQSYKDLATQVAEFKLAGLDELAKSQETATDRMRAATTWVDAYVESLKRAQADTQALITRGGTAAELHDLQEHYNALGDEIDRLSHSAEQATAATEAVKAAFRTGGVDADKLTAFIQSLSFAFEHGAISADLYFGTLANLGQMIDHFRLKAANADKIAEDQAAFLASTQKAIGAVTDAFAGLSDAQDAGLSGFKQFLEGIVAAGEASAAQQHKIAQEAASSVADIVAALGGNTDTRGFGERLRDAVDGANELSDAIDGVARSAVRQTKGLVDASDALDGFQRGFGRAGDTAAELARRMDLAGQLDLSDANEQALILQRRLERVEEKTAALHATIAQNQDDLSQWAANVSLVTDVLGGNTDQLDAWIKQVQDGTISQEQFNAAVSDPGFIASFDKLDSLYNAGKIGIEDYHKAQAAGVDILQRSVGGIQDEDAALAKNLITYDAYIKAHDDADDAVTHLTDAQQGFLVALESSQGQIALQTVQLAAYLAMMGLIPREKVTEIAADLGDADPGVKALLIDLGLIPDEKKTRIIVDADRANEQIAETDQFLQNVKPKKVKIDLDFAATGDGTELLAGTGLAAFEKTIPVKTKLEAPDTSAVDAVKPEPVRIDTVLKAPLTDPVDAYQPDPIRIDTILKAPLTDLVDNAALPTLTIPTELAAPTNSPFGEGVGTVAGLTIPTELGTPDATVLATYVPPSVTVPAVLGPPTKPTGFAAWGAPPDPVTVPSVLGAPDTTALDTFAATTYTTTLDADPKKLNDVVNTAITGIQDEFVPVWMSSLDAENDKALDAIDTAITEADAFAKTWTATLDVTNHASDDISAVQSALNALVKTYTVTLTADTTQATTALEDLARNLPSSPAKEGPLSRTPSFDYVTDSFVKSLEEMKQIIQGADLDVAPRVATAIAGGARFAAGAAGRALGTGAGGGGTTVINNTHLVALKSADFQRLLDGAERGTGAFAWIAQRERAYATVGG